MPPLVVELSSDCHHQGWTDMTRYEPPVRATLRPRWHIRGLAAASGAALLLAGACNGATTVEPVGEPEERSVEVFQAAVSEAFMTTLEAPSIVAVEEVRDAQGESIAAAWIDQRPDAAASVQVLYGDESGAETEIRAAVEAEGVLAIADSDLDEWVVGETGPDSLPAPRSVQRLVPVEWAPYLPDDETLRNDVAVTQQDTSDGGSVWTAAMPADFELISQTWGIHPDGHVRLYRFDVSSAEESSVTSVPANGLDWLEATLQPVYDPDPLPQPERGSSFDLEIFDLPDGFID